MRLESCLMKYLENFFYFLSKPKYYRYAIGARQVQCTSIPGASLAHHYILHRVVGTEPDAGTKMA